MSTLNPGDQVLFKRGDSFPGTLTITKSGSLGLPITFGAYGTGAKPIFSGTGATIDNLIYCILKSYLVFENINITDPTFPSDPNRLSLARIQRGINLDQCTSCTVQDCEMSLVGTGVYAPRNGSHLITRNTIYNLRMIVNDNNGGGNDYGANPLTIGSSNNIITYNTFYGGWAQSFDFTYDGGAIEFYDEGTGVNNNFVGYNLMYDNGGVAETGGSGGVANCNNNVFVYNKLINNRDVFYFHGSHTGWKFYNNVVIETVSNRLTPTSIMSGDSGKVTSIDIKNNVFQIGIGGNVLAINTGRITGTHTNNIYKLSGGTTLGFTLGSNETSTAASLFLDTSNADPTLWNYNPIAGSLLINSGAAVTYTPNSGLDFAGNPVSSPREIGILEYVGVTTSTTTSTSTTSTTTTSTTTTTTSAPLANAFRSVWTTAEDGDTIMLPLESTGTYNFNVNWGDGSAVETITSWTAASHTYATAGDYTIEIGGTIIGWRFNGDISQAYKFKQILQWGVLRLGNNGNYFRGCSHLTLNSVVDTPNLTGTTSLAGMFGECLSLTTIANLGSWNTASVIDFREMFSGAFLFNDPGVSSWVTTSAQFMQYMFNGAHLFNQNLSTWNTASVKNMSYMFQECYAFNSNISGWVTSAVTEMGGMFSKASVFNQPIGNWERTGSTVGNVTDMDAMFADASAFTSAIGNWNVGNVTDMSFMFHGSCPYNSSLSSWNTSKVTNMSYMFQFNTAFNQNISTWDVRAVTNFEGFMADRTNGSYSFYDQLLTAWSTQAVQPNLIIDFGAIKYTLAAQAARDVFASAANKNWIVRDGGPHIRLTVNNTAGGAQAAFFIQGTSAFTMTITWGDGSAVQTLSGSSSYTVNHTYLTTGTLTVWITVSNFGGIQTFNISEDYGVNNRVTFLDVTALVNLKNLYCGTNQISSLNLRPFSGLQILECNNNNLTFLNLEFLSIQGNVYSTMTTLNCANNHLTNLDITNVQYLKTLICNGNGLSGTIVSNLLIRLLDRANTLNLNSGVAVMTQTPAVIISTQANTAVTTLRAAPRLWTVTL
jgi:surface protein